MLGDISLNFIYLEQLLLSIIVNSLKIDSFFIDMLIGGDDFKVLVAKFKKAVIYVFDSNLKKDDVLYNELYSISTKLTDALQVRNKYMHGTIQQNPFKNIFELIKFRRDITKKDHSFIEFDTVTLETLKDVNKTINDCATLLSDFEQKIIKIVYPNGV